MSFLEALHAKYIELPHGSQAIEKIVLGSSHGAIQVEAANLDKIRQKFSNLAKLRVISLDAQLVSRPDEPGAITSTCPSESSELLSGRVRLSPVARCTWLESFHEPAALLGSRRVNYLGTRHA